MVSSGLVDRLDVSHFRLSIHLVIAFLILSLILWNYFKLNFDIKEQSQLNIFFPIVFLFLIFFANNYWCFCFRYGCWFNL